MQDSRFFYNFVKEIKTNNIMREYIVNFTAESKIIVKVNAESVTEAKELAVRKVDNMVTYDHQLKGTSDDVKIVFTQPLMYNESMDLTCGIMTPHNAHSVDLVKRINYAWETNKDGFHHIILALMKRDIEEMVDKNIFGEASEVTQSYDELFKLCEDGWEDITTYYLMRVADDADLEMILNMV